MTGSPVDKRTPRIALTRFFGLVLMCLGYVFLSGIMSTGSIWLRYLMTGAAVLAVAALFYSAGVNRGVADVEIGERCHRRQEADQDIPDDDRRNAFHPLKGFITGVIGTLPLLVCAIILAFTARRVMTAMGTLPDWMSSYASRSDLAGGLVAYGVHTPVTILDYVRVVVRVAVMPFVALVTAENNEAVLFIERISPLLVLIPAIASGIGYLQGPGARARIHTAIAKNKRRRRKAEKRREAARQAHLEKNQLN